jgi:hypothetical protein
MVQHGPSASSSAHTCTRAGSCARPSDEARLNVLRVRSFVLLPFHFSLRSGQGGQPLAHDVKQLRSVVEARAVDGPAWSVSEPSDEARLEVLVRVGPVFLPPCLFSPRSGQGSQHQAHDVNISDRSLHESIARSTPFVWITGPLRCNGSGTVPQLLGAQKADKEAEMRERQLETRCV